jgi:coenzyme Q-binding protein COQ10
MTKFNITKEIQCDAELINNVILDIEKYPEFLPWCNDAKILEYNNRFLIAELQIRFASFQESYISKVSFGKLKEKYFVNTEAISGPFAHLNSSWEIKMHNNLSLVHFSIDFTLKSKILGSIIGVFFLSASQKMISAFEERAKTLMFK